MNTRRFVLAGVVVALFLAGVVSFYASGSPDGLTKVSQDHGFAEAETAHASDGSPLAGYSTKGIANERLSTGVAGVTGTLVVLALMGGLVLVVRRRQPTQSREG